MVAAASLAAASLAAASLGGARLLAAGAAFYGVFGVFVVAFAVLCVVSVRWAVRRDRAGRAEWVARRQEQAQVQAPVQATGHRPGAVQDRSERSGAARTGRSGGGRTGRGGPAVSAGPHTNGHGPRRPGQRGWELNEPE